MDPTRDALLKAAADKLLADFKALAVVPHNGAKGMEAEALLRALLEQRLPGRFGVGSGFILSNWDRASAQMDIVIYDALNCPRLRVSDSASCCPLEHAADVLEVKSNLDRSSLAKACEQIAALKQIRLNLAEGRFPGNLIQPAGHVFAFTSDLTLDAIAEYYADEHRRRGVGYCADMIIAHNLGIVTLAARASDEAQWECPFVDAPGRTLSSQWQLGVAIISCGENTLSEFLSFLLRHLDQFGQFADQPRSSWPRNLGTRFTEVRPVGLPAPSPPGVGT